MPGAANCLYLKMAHYILHPDSTQGTGNSATIQDSLHGGFSCRHPVNNHPAAAIDIHLLLVSGAQPEPSALHEPDPALIRVHLELEWISVHQRPYSTRHTPIFQ